MHPAPTAPAPQAPPAAPPAPPIPSRRWALPAVAVATAAAAFIGTFVGQFIDDPAVYAAGPEAVHAELSGYLPTQLSAGALYAAAGLLVAFSVGLTRHLRHRAPDHEGTVDAMGVLLHIAAGTVAVGAILKSILASGLPGGTDADYYTQVDVAVSHTIAGQFQFAAFIPVVAAMAVMAVLALRHRVLPRYVGAVSAVFVVGVVGVTLALNLPWSAGGVAPMWLLLMAVAVWRDAGRA